MQLKKVGTCTFLLSCCPGMRFKGIKKTHRAEGLCRVFPGRIFGRDKKKEKKEKKDN